MRAPASFFLLFVVSVVSVVSGFSQTLTRGGASPVPATTLSQSAIPLNNAQVTTLAKIYNWAPASGSNNVVSGDVLYTLYTIADATVDASTPGTYIAALASPYTGIPTVHAVSTDFDNSVGTAGLAIGGDGKPRFAFDSSDGASVIYGACTGTVGVNVCGSLGTPVTINWANSAPGEGLSLQVTSDEHVLIAVWDNGNSTIRTIECATDCSGTPNVNTGLAPAAGAYPFGIHSVIGGDGFLRYCYSATSASYPQPPNTSNKVCVRNTNLQGTTNATPVTIYSGGAVEDQTPMKRLAGGQVVIGFGSSSGAAMAYCTDDTFASCVITQLSTNGEGVTALTADGSNVVRMALHPGSYDSGPVELVICSVALPGCTPTVTPINSVTSDLWTVGLSLDADGAAFVSYNDSPTHNPQLAHLYLSTGQFQYLASSSQCNGIFGFSTPAVYTSALTFTASSYDTACAFTVMNTGVSPLAISGCSTVNFSGPACPASIPAGGQFKFFYRGGNGGGNYYVGSTYPLNPAPLSVRQCSQLGAVQGACGVVVLSSGTYTVPTALIHPLAGAFGTGYGVILTRLSGCGTGCGNLAVGTVSDGASFVINSLSAANSVLTTDTSTVLWEIVQVLTQ